MAKKLQIFYRPDYASVNVENGVSRDVSGRTMLDVIRAMHPDDLGVLVAFSRAVCKAVDEPNSPSMFMTAKDEDR